MAVPVGSVRPLVVDREGVLGGAGGNMVAVMCGEVAVEDGKVAINVAIFDRLVVSGATSEVVDEERVDEGVGEGVITCRDMVVVDGLIVDEEALADAVGEATVNLEEASAVVDGVTATRGGVMTTVLLWDVCGVACPERTEEG